jgi:hypothetical protein
VIELTKEDLTGDPLHSTLLGYFAANETSQRIEQRTAGAVAYRLPSFGHFGVSVKVKYWYGIPRQVSFPGLMMDVDHWKDTAVMKDNDKARRITYNRQAGVRLSTFEHLVPEKFWTDVQSSDEGISAVKALAKAAAEGQKIYALTSQNASMVYQLQIDESVRLEILNALNAGRIVTVHEKPITILGWTGSGYILEDPVTGAGSYKISGGANGAWIPKTEIGLAMLSFFLPILAALGAAGPIALIILGASLIFSLMSYIKRIDKIIAEQNLTDDQKAGSIQVLSALAFFSNLIGGYKAGGGDPVSATLWSWLFSILAFAFNKVIDLFIFLPNYLPKEEGV